jgi:hypothetical protein
MPADIERTRKTMKLCLAVCVFAGIPLVAVLSLSLGEFQWTTAILGAIAICMIIIFLGATRNSGSSSRLPKPDGKKQD